MSKGHNFYVDVIVQEQREKKMKWMERRSKSAIIVLWADKMEKRTKNKSHRKINVNEINDNSIATWW